MQTNRLNLLSYVCPICGAMPETKTLRSRKKANTLTMRKPRTIRIVRMMRMTDKSGLSDVNNRKTSSKIAAATGNEQKIRQT